MKSINYMRKLLNQMIKNIMIFLFPDKTHVLKLISVRNLQSKPDPFKGQCSGRCP